MGGRDGAAAPRTTISHWLWAVEFRSAARKLILLADVGFLVKKERKNQGNRRMEKRRGRGIISLPIVYGAIG